MSVERDPRVSLDEAALLDRINGDVAFVKVIAEQFAHETAQRLEEIRRALEDRDGSALTRAAHALKGTLDTVGARAAAGLAAEIEDVGGGPLSDPRARIRIGEACSALEDELSRALDALSRLAERDQAPRDGSRVAG